MGVAEQMMGRSLIMGASALAE